MKKNEDNIYFWDLFKCAFDRDEDLSAGARIFLGVIGLVGTITADPVKRVFNALNINDDHPAPDPDDPTAPCNQNY